MVTLACIGARENDVLAPAYTHATPQNPNFQDPLKAVLIVRFHYIIAEATSKDWKKKIETKIIIK